MLHLIRTPFSADRARVPDGSLRASAEGGSIRKQAPVARTGGLLVEELCHSYRGICALDRVSFSVRNGAVLALLGPSGCGKSTLLRAVAGLLKPDSGRVSLDGRDMTMVPARKRSIGMVFQNFALFPHLTVRENIAYGLVSRGRPRSEIEAQVREMLRLVRLENLANRLPRQLSGGQQQRVAVARALAVNPSALLLDEPFGALDRGLRAELQEEFVQTQSKVGITTVVVTHDQEEAQMVASVLVVMNLGVIEQIGTPEEIYDSPATLFVNCFMGRANIFAGTYIGPNRVKLASGETVGRTRSGAFREESAVLMTARPEHVAILPPGAPGSIAATWVRAAPQAQHLLVDLVLSDGTPVKALVARHGGARYEPGAQVALHLDPATTHIFPAEA